MLAFAAMFLLSRSLRAVDDFTPPTVDSAKQQPVELRGQRIMLRAGIQDGNVREQYFARREGRWIEVATAGDTLASGLVTVIPAQNAPLVATAHNLRISDNTIIEEFDIGQHRIIRKLALIEDTPWIRVTTRLEPAGKLDLRQFSDHLRFTETPDWCYSPSVGGFNPDAQYKAPLILVQANRIALGIVPDVLTLGREELKRCNHALDLNASNEPLLAVGFIPARLASHSVYALDTNRVWTVETPVENDYFLLVTASAEPAQAYREAVRFHWERFGRTEQAHAADQQAGTDPSYRALGLWDDWRQEVWQQESKQKWLSVPLPDGSIGGGVRTRRWGSGPSVYLSSWFNTLRTSYGMALYARRMGEGDLLKLASQTLALALRAPGKDGAFKCIAVPGTNGTPTVWAAGDGAGDSTQDGFLGYDMCWTGYWLLQWRAAGLPGSDGVLSRCQKLAAFMIERQLPDGMLPTRFAEDGSVQQERSKIVKAETGPVVLFLLQLCQQDSNPLYLEAAKKGLAFLEREVIPQRQWYDYETFWSCSPRTPRLDPRTHQWPANNLALSQTVAAYLLAYRITGDPGYLTRGEALLDYLLLFQQCWTNPRLENLTSSAMLLGGFTTQNSDAEWSDARQSQCGNVLIDYYRATGKVEYLERGIAALRAQFPVSPSENWAHSGYGSKAGVSSFHWGTGSGMAGIEIEEDYLHDGIIDLAAGRGVGVNGLNIVGVSISDGTIRLSVSTPFKWKRPPVIGFRQTAPGQRYHVFVNAPEAGSWTGEELGKGVPLPPATDATASPVPGTKRDTSSQSGIIELTRDEILDHIRGGWTGMLIGGIEGLAHEFKYIQQPRQELPEYTFLPQGARTDDDNDFEWTHLFFMDKEGVLKIPYPRLVEIWKANMNTGIWCANEQARKLMDQGIVPPRTADPSLNRFSPYNLAGQFCVESYGMIAPGMPQSAGDLALHYARVSVSGEPLQAAQYWTTLVSLAAVSSEPLEELLKRSLAAVDPVSAQAEAVREGVDAFHQHPTDWKAARRYFHEKWYCPKEQPWDAQARPLKWNDNSTPLNGAMVILALLYSRDDFYRAGQYAMALGYDADCNAATACAVMGTRIGFSALQKLPQFHMPDHYQNLTRPELPRESKVSDQATLMLRLCEKLILANGGHSITIDGKPGYRIQLQSPRRLE